MQCCAKTNVWACPWGNLYPENHAHRVYNVNFVNSSYPSVDGYNSLADYTSAGLLDRNTYHGTLFRLHLFDNILFSCSLLADLPSSGTNPQSLRLTLLNADSSQALRVAIWYTTPQRLDVYRAGVYIYPTNAKLDQQNFSYKKKDPNLPNDQFEPTLTSNSGANYYDRESQLLYVVVKGNVAVDIRAAPVIQVKLGRNRMKAGIIKNLYILLILLFYGSHIV